MHFYNPLSLCKQFVKPGETCYEGMAAGEHTRNNDPLTSMPSEKIPFPASEIRFVKMKIFLPPVPPRTLEMGIGLGLTMMNGSKLTENILIRKKELKANMFCKTKRLINTVDGFFAEPFELG